MSTVELIISINVFQMPHFLDKQLASIASHVLSPYIVILNCNDYMFKALKGRALPPNVHINPEIINKARHHGSLTKGIASNMMYANSQFSYKYFIVLSGRTIFYRSITTANLDALNCNKWANTEQMTATQKGAFNANGWHWPKFRITLLAKHYLNAGFRLYESSHEGLTFSKNVTDNIIAFLQTHPDIKENIYNTGWCVEEFALQTIAQNEVNPANLEYGFLYIGNGCEDICDLTDPNKYTRKIRYA